MALTLQLSIDPENGDVLDKGSTVIVHDDTQNFGQSGNPSRGLVGLYMLPYEDTVNGYNYVKPEAYDPLTADSWTVKLERGGMYLFKIFAVPYRSTLSSLDGVDADVNKVYLIGNLGLIKITDYDANDGYSYVDYEEKLLDKEASQNYIAYGSLRELLEFSIAAQINRQTYLALHADVKAAEKAMDLYLRMLATIFAARESFEANRFSDTRLAMEMLRVMAERSDRFGY